VKEDKILLTDNAVRYVKDDIIHLNGNTMMINKMDTLACDSMVYWSKIDSIYALGNIRFVHGSERGMLGDEMEIQYADTLVEMIRVFKNAFAYNNLNLRITKYGPNLFFRDEMSSKEMIAYFEGEYISRLELINMATTSYHVVDDSLLAGNNMV
jgi:lipopolysaccharide assembly outer membrane protein LptD (OstA)